MNKNFKLTILMPCYNREPYMREALDSIFAQVTNFNYKLIIIDDASTDNTLQIAKEYKQKYPDNIELIENEKNLKLLGTMFKGYTYLKTDYFCVLDPDDYYTDNHVLQNAVDFLETHPDYTIYSTNYEVLENNEISPSWLKGDFLTRTSDFIDYLNGRAHLGNCIVTVFRNIIFKNGAIPHKLTDMLEHNFIEPFDSDSFRNAIHIKEGKALFFNKPAGVYRKHSTAKFSPLSHAEKELFGAEFYYNLYIYFDNKTYCNLIIMSLHCIDKAFNTINQISFEKREKILPELNHLQNKIQKLKINNRIKMTHMRNTFFKFCSCFILNANARRNFRRKYMKLRLI